MNLSEEYLLIRKHSEEICEPLQTEDYVVQPIVDVSPPKWHLGHTTWFFETFILKPFSPEYQEFNPDYNYVFNSYYETVGARVIRTDRGNLSRPSVNEVYQYRAYVDEAMAKLLSCPVDEKLTELLHLGFNHEQQHQELLLTDIKYILGNNPLFPVYDINWKDKSLPSSEPQMIAVPEGVYEVGYSGNGFCFDNELSRHKVYLQNFAISTALVTNGEYLDFIEAGGYKNFSLWHAEGWDWVNNNQIVAPMYWSKIDDA